MLRKIGIHSIGTSSAVDYVRRVADAGGCVPAVLSCNNGGIVIDVKRFSPNTITLWRIWRRSDEWVDGYDLDRHEDYQRAAETRMAAILAHSSAEERAATDYFVTQNEPRPHTPNGWYRLGLQAVTFMELAEAHSMHVALFGLNVGTPPTWAELEAFVDSGFAERAVAGGHCIALHEGIVAAPDVPEDADCRFGVGIDMEEHGYPRVDGAGVFTLRYRYLLHALRKRGLDRLPRIVLSEFYPCIKDLRRVSAEMLMSCYRWLDAQLCADDCVIAALPYTLATGDQWQSQRHETLYTMPGGLLDSMIPTPETNEDNGSIGYTFRCPHCGSPIVAIRGRCRE